MDSTIYVKTLDDVAVLAIRLIKAGVNFNVRSNGLEWVFEIPRF